MPKCTINGKEVEVEQGTTIIEAFKKVETDIAHYCWHPGLTVAGVCRLCMVEIEGMPRLQIACNTEVRDGMVINNNSEKVKETVKWGMDFHLINHPLDCPICDQAGECGLQDQYMKFGQYNPEMAEKKVKKHKVVDLGSKIVLDSERCILCSRCVRFTDEVTKTNELGIFNRGDRSEIGTFDGKPLENDYAMNTVDLCPVGALTSKDFRFRQRVWYLKEAETVCPGCSTGCNVKVYYNEEGLFRVKPVHNDEVNDYWMCDKGRDTYKFVNPEARLLTAKFGRKDQWEDVDPGKAVTEAGEKLKQAIEKSGPESVALVITGQYTNEEYEQLLSVYTKNLLGKNVYHWISNPDEMEKFDGILFRGDRNPNTAGLKEELAKFKVGGSWSDLEAQLNQGKIRCLVVAGPENHAVYPDLADKLSIFSKAESLVWMSAGSSDTFVSVDAPTWQIPMKTYIEKDGTFVNHEGKRQLIRRGATIVKGALSLSQAAVLLSGSAVSFDEDEAASAKIKTNFFVQTRGSL